MKYAVYMSGSKPPLFLCAAPEKDKENPWTDGGKAGLWDLPTAKAKAAERLVAVVVTEPTWSAEEDAFTWRRVD